MKKNQMGIQIGEAIIPENKTTPEMNKVKANKAKKQHGEKSVEDTVETAEQPCSSMVYACEETLAMLGITDNVHTLLEKVGLIKLQT